jgi:uncharacterized protein (TIGR00661 family)
MKILYAIQGKGFGHIVRASEIIPLLRKKCETDVLISGDHAAPELPFEVKYNFKGLNLVYNRKGEMDLHKTYKKANTKKFLHEVQALPIHEYAFVLNDFEPVSAWAAVNKGVPCIALSHQAALVDKNVPVPRPKGYRGSFILKNYAPASHFIGLHYSRYSSKIFTPVIRKDIRESERLEKGHYMVYLPLYEDKVLIDILERLPEVHWRVFSPHCKTPYQINNISFAPLNYESFAQNMASSDGVLCGAGFETPAEALFLGKKLLVIADEGRFEQQYNALALKNLGVPVIKKLKASKVDVIEEWVEKDYKIEITYPDCTDRIINRIFELYVTGELLENKKQNKFRLIP